MIVIFVAVAFGGAVWGWLRADERADAAEMARAKAERRLAEALGGR